MSQAKKGNQEQQQEHIDELLSKGKEHGGVLTYKEILDSMQSSEDMTPEDMDEMYELFARKGIEVVDEIRGAEAAEVSSTDNTDDLDAEELSVPEGIGEGRLNPAFGS